MVIYTTFSRALNVYENTIITILLQNCDYFKEFSKKNANKMDKF